MSQGIMKQLSYGIRLVFGSSLLAAAVQAAPPSDPPEVLGQLKIAGAQGGFSGTLGPFDSFGSALAVVGDLDGNGTNEVAVGAPGSTTPQGGAVWILFLAADDSVLAAARIDALTAGLTLDANDNFGASLAALGDLDGDGHLELAVGAPNRGPGLFLGPGAVFVLSLDEAGAVLDRYELAEGVGGVPGPTSATGFGVALAALGDLDGNGITDLAVSDSTGGAAAEIVWLLELQADASALAAVAIAQDHAAFAGLPVAGDGLGRALAGLGDLDGNGTPDLALGEPNAGALNTGAVWVAFLDAGPSLDSAVRIAPGENGFGWAIADQAGFGGALAGGDLDSDGVTDLVVGSSFDDDLTGRTWILGLDAAGLVVQGETYVDDDVQGFSGPLDFEDQFGSAVVLLPEAGGDHQLLAGARGDGGSFLLGPGALWVLDLEAPDPWTNLGHGLAGVNGLPLLKGTGPLLDGSLNSIDLLHAVPSGSAALIIGFSQLNVGFKGGTLVPNPFLIVYGMPIDVTGKMSLPFVWPPAVPPGVFLFFQTWMADVTGPKGFSASNGLQALTP
jgi:FG-GAP repeat